MLHLCFFFNNLKYMKFSHFYSLLFVGLPLFNANSQDVILTINVNNPGNLHSDIEKLGTESMNISHLKITGGINYIDFVAIKNLSQLSYLDLSESTINYYNGNDPWMTQGLSESAANAIPDYIFEENENLKKIILPENLEMIGKKAFYKSGLEGNLNFPISLKEIKDSAYYESANIEIDLSSLSNLEKLCSYVFSKCENVKEEVVFPENLLEIGEGCFENCLNIKKVSFGDNLKIIDKYAFRSCESLEKISLPNSVELIGFGAFDETNISSTNGTVFFLPENLVTLEQFAFNRTKISYFYISPKNKYFHTSNGVIYDKDKTKLILYPAEMGGKPDILNTVRTIGDRAFANCKNLSSNIILPEKINKLEVYSFGHCNLGTIVLPDSLEIMEDGMFWNTPTNKILTYELDLIDFSKCNKLKKIGRTLFGTFGDLDKEQIYSYQNNIEEIDLSHTVLEVGENFCFTSMKSLKKISLPSTIQKIETAFIYANNLEEIEIHAFNPPVLDDFFTRYVDVKVTVPKGSKELYKNAPVWSQFNNIVEFGEEDIVYHDVVIISENSPYIITQKELSGTTKEFYITSNKGHNIESVRINGVNVDSFLVEEGKIKLENIDEDKVILITTSNVGTVNNINESFSSLKSWQVNSEIYIASDKKIKEVKIYNTNGEILAEDSGLSYYYTLPLNIKGVVIIKAEFENNVIESKKMNLN